MGAEVEEAEAEAGGSEELPGAEGPGDGAATAEEGPGEELREAEAATVEDAAEEGPEEELEEVALAGGAEAEAAAVEDAAEEGPEEELEEVALAGGAEAEGSEEPLDEEGPADEAAAAEGAAEEGPEEEVREVALAGGAEAEGREEPLDEEGPADEAAAAEGASEEGPEEELREAALAGGAEASRSGPPCEAEGPLDEEGPADEAAEAEGPEEGPEEEMREAALAGGAEAEAWEEPLGEEGPADEAAADGGPAEEGPGEELREAALAGGAEAEAAAVEDATVEDAAEEGPEEELEEVALPGGAEAGGSEELLSEEGPADEAAAAEDAAEEGPEEELQEVVLAGGAEAEAAAVEDAAVEVSAEEEPEEELEEVALAGGAEAELVETAAEVGPEEELTEVALVEEDEVAAEARPDEELHEVEFVGEAEATAAEAVAEVGPEEERRDAALVDEAEATVVEAASKAGPEEELREVALVKETEASEALVEPIAEDQAGQKGLAAEVATAEEPPSPPASGPPPSEQGGFRVLVVGGGLTGLAVALCLHQRGLPCTVLDAAAAVGLEPPGGVLLPPFAAGVLRSLGLLEAVEAEACSQARQLWCSSGGAAVLERPLSRGVGQDAVPALAIQRGVLVRLLAGAVRARLGPNSLVSGARVEAIEETEACVRVSYRDRATGALRHDEAHVLLGCDGGHSRVHRHLFPGEAADTFRRSGAALCVGTAWLEGPEVPQALEGGVLSIGGPRQQVSLSLIGRAQGGRQCVQLAVELCDGLATSAPSSVASRSLSRHGKAVPAEDVLNAAKGIDTGFLDLRLLAARAGRLVARPLDGRPPADAWSRGRAALAGAAACAPRAAGLGELTLAFHQAWVLAEELHRAPPVPPGPAPDAAAVHAALRRYERRCAAACRRAGRSVEAPEAAWEAFAAVESSLQEDGEQPSASSLRSFEELLAQEAQCWEPPPDAKDFQDAAGCIGTGFGALAVPLGALVEMAVWGVKRLVA